MKDKVFYVTVMERFGRTLYGQIRFTSKLGYPEIEAIPFVTMIALNNNTLVTQVAMYVDDNKSTLISKMEFKTITEVLNNG